MSSASVAVEKGNGGGPSSGYAHRILRVFTDVRPGEAGTVLLLTVNIFLLLLAYYLIKPVREALVMSSLGPLVKGYLAAAQSFLFIFVIYGFSRLASKVARHILIATVTLFFISNLGLFFLLHAWGMPKATLGVIFFIWVGIFNILVVAQFWGFANDLYTEEAGTRLFPLVAFGQTFGALVGTRIAKAIIGPLGKDFAYFMMLITAGVLVFCILLTVVIHRRAVRLARRREPAPEAKPESGSRTPPENGRPDAEKPLGKVGGFRLIFSSRYLFLYACLILILNFVNNMGENIWSLTAKAAADHAVLTGTTGGLDKTQYLGSIYSDYQFAYSLVALVVQLFLVSRIFKWIGVGGALLVLPFIALGGYSLVGMGASLLLVKWVKGVENGVDYSLMNTIKGTLFLVTSREEKYKGKAAADTFFYRTGDALAAGVLFLGANFLGISVEGYARMNVVITLGWIVLCVLLMREYRKRHAKRRAAPAS